MLIISSVLSSSAFALEDVLGEMESKVHEITEKLNPKSIIDLFTSNLFSFAKDLRISFGLCLTTILISSVFCIIKSSLGDSDNLFNLISSCLIILTVYSPITACFTRVQEHIEAICGFMISLIPTCVMLHTSSGNTLSAAFMSSGSATFITLIQTISISVIIPLIKASLCVMTVNTICQNTNLSSMASTLKNISLWITGLCFTLFTGVLSLQSILQSGADNLAVKGLKYGAAKLIPIAGGMISESMKTVITGVGYIKSVTGISGIIFIIYALVPPICFIIMTKLYLSMLSFASKLTDGNGIHGFLDFANSIINILLAVLLSCSVSFIIILTIFIKSTVSL